jgi:gas vesicle protein
VRIQLCSIGRYFDLEEAMSATRMTHRAVGFVIGLGVGAALGFLFAPQSGEETREYLATSARDAVDDAVATGQRLRRRAKQAISDVADEVSEQIRDASDAGERAYVKAKGAGA